jgi:hypothetical protein
MRPFAKPSPEARSPRGRLLVAGSETLEPRELERLCETFTVYVAALGREVLGVLRDGAEEGRRPAVLIVGQELDDISTTVLCRTLRADQRLREQSVLLVSGPDTSPEAAGAVNVALRRPVNTAELLTTVAKLARVEVRLATRIPLQLDVHLRTGLSATSGVTRNISASGMLIEVSQPVATGTKVTTRWNLPGYGSEIVANAHVMRSLHAADGSCALGVQFVDLCAPDSQAIAQFVAKSRVAVSLR